MIERNLKTMTTNITGNKWSTALFKIKLTEFEYKELMKEKSKLVKI